MDLDWLRRVPPVLPEAPKPLVTLVKRLSVDRDESEYEGVERRSHPRTVLVKPVWVQPLSDAHEPTGEGFSAVSRDISTSGLGIVHTQAVDSPFLGVVIMAEKTRVHVIAKVLRCEPLGPFYDVGCSLEMRVDPNELMDS